MRGDRSVHGAARPGAQGNKADGEVAGGTPPTKRKVAAEARARSRTGGANNLKDAPVGEVVVATRTSPKGKTGGHGEAEAMTRVDGTNELGTNELGTATPGMPLARTGNVVPVDGEAVPPN